MSHFGAGQFDETEAGIERRIQEELRVRQATTAASRLTGSLGHGAAASFQAGATDRNFLSSMIAAESAAAGAAAYPYARGATAAATGPHSPFARQYGALGAAAGAAAYPTQGDAAVASLYARQRAQYGYTGAAVGAGAAERAAYGYAVPAEAAAMYQQHFAGGAPRSAQEMSLLDRAAAYNAQQRQAEQANAAMLTTKSPTMADFGYGPPKSSPKSKASMSSSPSGAPVSPVKSRPKKPPTPSSRPSSSEKKEKKEGEDQVALPTKWYSGCVPLGLDDDKYWLSELQVFLRANFAEAFGATEEDIAAPMHGRNKPIALGQVGIRCTHCKHESPSERGQQATSYPSLISGIYNSVQQMLRLHLDCCQAMPPQVRQKIEQLKISSSSRGGRKQYWVDSAKRLGLMDTPHGIHFGRDPLGPLPPLTGPSVNSKEGRKKKEAQKKLEAAEAAPEPQIVPQVEERPLVFPEDQPLISDYLYLTLEQMSPCVLMEADRVGCYKTRKVGFPGLACKHCVGQAGCGRYFPASEASLSQTTTSQTIMNHVRNCRRCPMEIRENLEIMKRARMGPDGKRADKPKHGGRKVFFRRLWCRIQGIPMDESKEGKEKKKRKRSGKRAYKKKQVDSDGEESDDPADTSTPQKHTESSDEESESESSEGSDSEEETNTKERKKKAEKKRPAPWFTGCVRLTKSDDASWLSEVQCFARSDMIEAFSWNVEDGLCGYTGRKDPQAGQVAIRCVFCKVFDSSERPQGSLVFPDSLANVHTRVNSMLRLHFHSCPGMPEETKQTYRTLRGFSAKLADDSQQYWVDSARDIGLSNVPPENGGWGITFRRDPLQPSPCDELDRETNGAPPPTLSKAYLIDNEDRSSSTDQVTLMMRQVKACTFEKKDRRGGPGSRGRDRVVGFPGLCCKYCASKNNTGRYFPVSAKNLTDNTANSLLSHVASCGRCPEPIKASIAFLSHRSILQKAELSGSWKKAFFKKVWDRLHVERAWVAALEEEDPEDAESASSEESEEEEDEDGDSNASGEEGEGAAEGEEAVGGNMKALMKAAAIWLTEQDQSGEPSGGRKGATSSRGRALPGNSKRAASTAAAAASPPARGKGSRRGSSSLTEGKRRRVHF